MWKRWCWARAGGGAGEGGRPYFFLLVIVQSVVSKSKFKMVVRRRTCVVGRLTRRICYYYLGVASSRSYRIRFVSGADSYLCHLVSALAHNVSSSWSCVQNIVYAVCTQKRRKPHNKKRTVFLEVAEFLRFRRIDLSFHAQISVGLGNVLMCFGRFVLCEAWKCVGFVNRACT